MESLLAIAWPSGLAEEELATLRKLPSDEELLVRKRLEALLEVEAGTRPASRPPSDDPRGLTASGFQSLVRRWRADRSVRTLLPYSGRTPRRRAETPESEAVTRVIDSLLRADPKSALATISREALRQTGSGLAMNTVRALARERRSALRADPAWLADYYGTELLADVCTLASFLPAEGEGAVAAIALLVEGATGIVFGHAVGSLDEAQDLQRSAMADGLATIVAEGADIAGTEAARLIVVLPPGGTVGANDYAAALRKTGSGIVLVDSPRRRSGDRVADLLDGAIDVLPLRPRGGRATRRTRATNWDTARLASAAEEAVKAHNRERLASIREAIPEDRLTPMGSMVEALRPAVDIG